MELGFSHGPLAGSLPSCRIKCNGARIQVGSRDFTSATEALQAYLDQYSGLTTRMSVPYKRDVSDLLDPKSILHMTADRSLQTGVRDTQIEMKLADVKTSMNSNYDRMEKSSKLRKEGRIIITLLYVQSEVYIFVEKYIRMDIAQNHYYIMRKNFKEIM